ncbi:MAG: right-handed parallel beta-helix repeat-containing protein, partial [Usitatibacteraceae bacterium]
STAQSVTANFTAGVLLVVTSTAEVGVGTLTSALTIINNQVCNAQTKRIEFNIPAATDPGCNPVTGVCVVQLEPFNGRNISCPNVVVDGYTQPGASPNTATDHTNNAQLKIEFAGTGGLTLNHDNITVRGIAFAAMQANIGVRQVFGIGLVSTGGQVLAGNYFGWHADGLTPAGFNGEHRVSVGSNPVVFSARIGGPNPADRNLITHTLHGNGLRLSGASNALVEGNVFNLDRNGNAVAGANASQGILLDAGGNNANTIRRNVITQTKVSGVQCTGGSSTTLSENEIFDVGSSGAANARGIELQPGCNRNQTAPVINSVTFGANVNVQGTLTSVPNETFEIEFFHNVTPDTANIGRAEQFVGFVEVTTNASGVANFGVDLPTYVRNVSSTATRLSTGDTSAFSSAEITPQALLTVSKSGSTSSVVNSVPSGINCGTTCTYNFAPGTQVTLTALPASGAVFLGWSGACTNSSGTCSVTMSGSQNVSANFADAERPTAVIGVPPSFDPISPGITGVAMTLSGIRSFAIGGATLVNYRWSVVQRPAGSTVMPTPIDTVAPTLSFTPDRVGAFRVQLEVTSNQGAISTPDSVQITVTDPQNPTAVLDVTPPAGITGVAMTLSGSRSFGIGSVIASYRWSVTQRPVGSTVLPTPI